MPKNTKKVVDIETQKRTNTTNETETTGTTTNPTTTPATDVKEIVDIDWGEAEPVFNAREQLKQMEDHLGSMCIHFEKSKGELVQRINYIESMLYKMAEDLKTKKGLDENLTYELKLPKNRQEKAYFLLRNTPNNL